MPKTVQDRFFNDPEWHLVSEMIMEFINPLLDMTTIDTTQSSEAVKAEIVGRTMAYKLLSDFVEQSKLVIKKPKVETNPFR